VSTGAAVRHAAPFPIGLHQMRNPSVVVRVGRITPLLGSARSTPPLPHELRHLD